MLAWQIVSHTFELLLRNLGDALKVSVWPVLCVVVFALLIFLIIGGSADQMMLELTTGTVAAPLALGLLMLLLAVVFASAWIAVAWHRFILLAEYPGMIPAIADRPIVTYAWRSFVLGLVMILALVPAVIVTGILAQVFGPDVPAVMFLLGFALGVYFSYFWLRIAVILPAIAIGKTMSLSEAWAATAPLSSAILGASAILVALNIGVSGIVGALSGGAVALIIDIVVNWVTLMIGTSILTTIYGNAVEGRPLA
jgi:hypothetical protein